MVFAGLLMLANMCLTVEMPKTGLPIAYHMATTKTEASTISWNRIMMILNV
jgi:hypothetical protein